MTSGATALDLPFVGLTATLNHQYQRRSIDLFGYQRPNYFAILVPEMGISKSFQQKLIIGIRVLLLFLLLLLSLSLLLLSLLILLY